NSQQPTQINNWLPFLFTIKTQGTVVFKSRLLCLEFFSFLKISQYYLKLPKTDALSLFLMAIFFFPLF
ncbi:hypothetical protein, partial [Rodentibacter ratti]|uniref:hypothetical protein n=1 Tax=Rodentibacter ratti TaxID=1906745 RepID=UPI001C4DDB7A